MSDLPFLPLSVSDYIWETMHCTPEQFGAYMRLVMHAWRHGGAIKSDVQNLCRITGVTARRWPKVAEGIAKFFDDDGTSWVHIRSQELHQKATAKSVVRSELGRRGNEVKRLKRLEAAHAKANANDTQTGTQTARNYNYNYKEERESARAQAPAHTRDFLDLEGQGTDPALDALEAYNTAAKRKGRWPVAEMTPERWRSITSALEIAGGLARWTDMLQKAEASTWLGASATFAIGIDWFVNPLNLRKVLEGNYDDRAADKQQRGHSAQAGRGNGVDGLLAAIGEASVANHARQHGIPGDQPAAGTNGPLLDLPAAEAVASRVRGG